MLHHTFNLRIILPGMFLIFDTETTGLPKNWRAPITDSDNWPRVVQLAWQLHDTNGRLLNRGNYIIKPDGFDIPYAAQKVHGISTERAMRDGHDLAEVLQIFSKDLERAGYNVGHNIGFDIQVTGAEFYRCGLESPLLDLKVIDTKDEGTDFCAIPGGKGGRYKWPTLTELHEKLFGQGFGDAHDAAYDVDATARCFFGLIDHRVTLPPEITDPELVDYEAPELEAANFQAATEEVDPEPLIPQASDADVKQLADDPFVHLHCHSQYSILQATTEIQSLIGTAKSQGMSAIAMTDHGNMMGAFQFVQRALNEDIKPIVGSEFNVCKDRLDKSHKDDGFQQVLIAKNKAGYHNLAKLSSLSYTDGFYYVPRIDKAAILQYKDHLIATTGGLFGEVPYLILNVGESQAEEAFLWWKEHFGENFYAELSRHGLKEEEIVNKTLLQFCEKHGVRYFAANNTYYTAREDAEAHDTLLCVKDAETVNKPKRYIGKRGREFRFGFPNDEFYIKSPDEMKRLFADLPDAIRTTGEIADQIESFELARDVLLPKFDIPAEFRDPEDEADGGNRGENNYLRHLTYEGAKERYDEITDEIRERLDFELEIIANTGYPGYFLIVQDFTRAAREMGVSVGPGRGSAAGSAVAYCIGITNVDPIAYDLLFERFLNPDRVSMPDIDIDFDDEGRQKVIDYVIEKYGANQVAQIITYGTMAAKSSIRDTGRVLELPLPDTDRIAKLVPDIKLAKLFGLDEKGLKEKLKNNPEDLQKAADLKKIAEGNNLEALTVNRARVLEGSVRNTGIHACGVIITPDDITNFVPVATAKDSDMCCTQFDNAVVEDAGLLKMDFLGLKTLTLIKHAVRIVKERHGVDIDPDKIPLDDKTTYELFQRGETVGIFQYESAGMQKYLKDLKPTVFADLIAMNALYRPGPLKYIPSFVNRKHGREKIEYDLEACKEFLEETYGITVYQEQVMLLSQKLSGFSKGEADTLRKAMGKKKFALLAKMKPKFLDQGEEHGHDRKVLEKIWTDWEDFASYAFNKSHSTCYAWVAFQTAYLKANYPAEYMASVLSNNMNDIKSVTFFMEECKRMGIAVLGPDVNESEYHFTVNTEGAIRFGMGAIKGVGRSAVESIVEERKANGPYSTIYDFFKRLNFKTTNKKTLESLAQAGALDDFDLVHRAVFFTESNGQTFLDSMVRHGQALQEAENAPPDLFGGVEQVEISDPPLPAVPEWDRLVALNKEKEVVGIFISGHPLDDFRYEVQNLCLPVDKLKDLSSLQNREITFGGIVSTTMERIDKRGNPFGRFTIEDYSGSHEFFLFRDDYAKFRGNLVKGAFIYVRAKVSDNPYRQEKELKWLQVGLLSEMMENQVKSLQIDLPVQRVTEDLVLDLKTILNGEKGSCKVVLQLIDREKNMIAKLRSRSIRTVLTSEKIRRLEQLPGVGVRIGQ